jgi:Tol biopolymer transport system component
MELAPCPKCGAFSDADAKECSQCHAPLDAEPEAGSSPPIALAPIEPAPEPEPPPAEEAVVEEAAAPAPFDAPPEVLAKVDKLEADIAQKPNVPGFYIQLSKIYVEANRKDLAVATLERLLAVDPSNAYVRHKHAQLTGVPEAAAHAPASSGPAAAAPAAGTATRAAGTPARPTAGAARPAQTFVAGVAQRPAAAPVPNMMRGMGGRTKAIIGGSLALVLAVIVAKVLLFPDAKVLVAGDFRAFGSSWSPTGKHLAFVLDDGRSTRLAVYDLRAGSYRPLVAAAAWDSRGFAWSPDGTKIAYTAEAGGDDGGEAVHVVDVASGQSRRLAAGSAPLWSAGGQILMTCGPERSAFIDEDSYTEIDWTPRFCTVDAVTGEVKRGGAVADYGVTISPLLEKALSERYAETATAAAAPTSSGEGEFQDMAQSVAESGARNVAQGSRNLSRELQARQYTERRKAARGASRLSYAADVVVTDIGSGSAVQVTNDGQSAYPSWTPDGSRILFATNGPAGIEMWTMNADGGDRRMVVPGTVKIADPSSVTLSKDGRDVFFIAPVPGDPGLAKIMTGESPADLHVVRAGENAARRLANRHPFKQRYAVSPDGKRIAYEVLRDVTMVGGAQKSEIWLLKR